MKTKYLTARGAWLLALAALDLQFPTAFAQSTAFTYQGRLNSGANPITGIYDLAFAICSTASNAAPNIAITNTAVGVTNGLFTTLVDFGAAPNNFATRWLEISVRTNGAAGGFTTLAPRQQLTPAPYAFVALTASNLSGTAGTATNFMGALHGDVTGGQGGTVVSSVGGQAAASVASGASAALAATSFNVPGAIVARDGTGSFQAQDLALNGNLYLPAATPGEGIIYAGITPLVLSYGVGNFFAGSGAGNLTMSGYTDTGIGAGALQSDTGGSANTALGNRALQLNTTGADNTAAGALALQNNTSGSDNTASGDAALLNNVTGDGNTAAGSYALYANTNGSFNTASGNGALLYNTSGNNNTAHGASALGQNISGTNNISLGYLAGFNILGNNNIDLGNQGLAADNNTIRLGDVQTQTFIAGVINGNGGGLTNLSAGKLTGTAGSFSATNIIATGAITGNGAGLTNLNAANLAGSGALSNLTLSGNLYLPAATSNAGIVYSGSNTLIGVFPNSSAGNFFAGLHAGNASSSGSQNTAVGASSLGADAGGSGNTSLGYKTLYANADGGYNTALGDLALYANLIGSYNSALGNSALVSNTNGSENTASGDLALALNTSGSQNTAHGNQALGSNLTGNNNIALGYQAGFNLLGSSNIAIGNPGQTTDNGIIRLGTPGTHNTAFLAGTITGNGAGLTNLNAANLTGSISNISNLYLPATTASAGIIYAGGIPLIHAYGNQSIFAGPQAGNFNSVGYGWNTGIGFQALNGNTTGCGNTAGGYEALLDNTSGRYNTAIGMGALLDNSSGSNNIALGYFAGGNIYGNYDIDIGNAGVISDNYTIRIGDVQTQTYIAGVINGNGGGLTNLNAAALTGSVSNVSNLYLPATTANSGIIYCGTNSLIQAYGNYSFFAGSGAGNLTMIGVGYNTGSGYQALHNNFSGADNTASGYQALSANTTGNDNTAIGMGALLGNTTGGENIALGSGALSDNMHGNNNTALGYWAGYLISGNNNICIGNNGTGTDNGIIRLGTPGTHTNTFIAGTIFGNGGGLTNLNLNGISAMSSQHDLSIGYQALPAAMSGWDNTACGYQSLSSNILAGQNTAIGSQSLNYNYGGGGNTAVGCQALFVNFDGSRNTACGAEALPQSEGDDNVAMGYGAINGSTNGFRNTAIGTWALNAISTGSNNIAIGYQAGDNLAGNNLNNIVIGNHGAASDNNLIRIGAQGTQTNTFIAGIYGATAASGVAVYVNANGQLGNLTSSQKYKQDIRSMDDASDALLALHPVTFRYKPDIDPQGIPQFGLVAEDVEKVNPKLVVHDQEHGIYTVRYEAVNAMLLNEFLKEHKTVEAQSAEIQALKQSVAELRAMIDHQASQ